MNTRPYNEHRDPAHVRGVLTAYLRGRTSPPQGSPRGAAYWIATAVALARSDVRFVHHAHLPAALAFDAQEPRREGAQGRRPAPPRRRGGDRPRKTARPAPAASQGASGPLGRGTCPTAQPPLRHSQIDTAIISIGFLGESGSWVCGLRQRPRQAGRYAKGAHAWPQPLDRPGLHRPLGHLRAQRVRICLIG